MSGHFCPGEHLSGLLGLGLGRHVVTIPSLRQTCGQMFPPDKCSPGQKCPDMCRPDIQGVPEKSFSQRLLHISIVKKATKLIFTQLERWILPARFEYRTTSERYLVTEICKSEVTEPRNRTNVFQEIYCKHFTGYVHVYNYYAQMCAHIFSKKSFW